MSGALEERNIDEQQIEEALGQRRADDNDEDIFLTEPGALHTESSGSTFMDNGSLSPTFRDPMSPCTTYNSRAESVAARPKLGSRLEFDDPFLSSTRSTPNQIYQQESGGGSPTFSGSPDTMRSMGSMREFWTPSQSPEPSQANRSFQLPAAAPPSQPKTRLRTAPNPPRFVPRGKATDLASQCTSLKLIPPQVIKLGFVKELNQKELPEPLKANHKLLQALPTELLVPMALRCDFCVKFDSVCSKCHFRFKAILKSRQAVLMKNVAALTGDRPVAILFNSILNGHEDFLQALVEHIPKSRFWVAVIPTTPITEFGEAKNLGDKRQLGLHVACAFDRPRSAKILLKNGFRFQRSEARLVPSELLESVSAEWEDAFSASTEYKEHLLAEEAKELRKHENYDNATQVYADLLELNPRSEKAYLGMAKMLYDQKKFTDCLEQCKLLLERYEEINWVDFRKSTITELAKKATAGMHAYLHPLPGSALKECGCVVLDNITISIRRLPFSHVKRILEFCDCVSLWGVWRSSAIPLLQGTSTFIGAALCDTSVGEMLSHEFAYEEMYESIKGDPVKNGSHAVVTEPLRFIGLQVTAMADFHTFIIKSSVVGENPLQKEADTSMFFRKPREPIEKLKRVVATKEFRVNRAGVGKAWDVHDAGEWEVDLDASEALVEAIQRRMDKK